MDEIKIVWSEYMMYRLNLRGYVNKSTLDSNRGD